MMRWVLSIIAAVVVLAAAASSFYIVDPRDAAVVLSFQQVAAVVRDPGLHFKWPYPIDQVVYIDQRLQTIDTDEPEHFLTAGKRTLAVGYYGKWKVEDPVRYFGASRGDQAFAVDRLRQLIRAALGAALAQRSATDIVASAQDELARAVTAKVDHDARELGISVTDVRLTQIDYLAAITDKVYERMRAERVRVANETRAAGAAEEERIRADADRQRDVILANAYEKAQAIRGEGDAKAAQIAAEAFGRDPQFYEFYKSLEAYQAAFHDRADLIVVDPNSDFFKYMRSPGSPAPGKK